MPKRCPDPRCPVNEYYSYIKKTRRDNCKIHGKPSVTFASDDARKSYREHGRIKCCSRWNKAKDVREEESKRDNHNWGCCKNKKCQTSKCTVERATSTDTRPKTCIVHGDVRRSQASKKVGMQFHRHEDKGRPCECAHKRYYKGMEETAFETNRSSKGQRRYRSRRKRRRKCGWLRNCFIRLCICAKPPKDSMESDIYVPSPATLLRTRECCYTHKDKYREASKSRNSRKRTRGGDEGLVRRCQCTNSVVKNRTLPQDQSYLQGTFSRRLNSMLKNLNFCT